MTVSGAHLVGSVPLPDAEAVFITVAPALGAHLKRIPDGETGIRSNWIQWQYDVLAAARELRPATDGAPGRPPPLTLSGDTLQLPVLGYAEAARTAFAHFDRLQRDGTIPAHCRFQVCVPTPLAPVNFYVAEADRARVEPVYEARLMEEVAALCSAIPHERLAVQWDTAVEFGVLEGVFPSHLGTPEVDIVTRLLRLGNAIPQSVELGYHLCYGDAGHKHFTEPRDTGKLVAVANAVLAGLSRSVGWIHLPVPRDRDDDGYFEPLRGLELTPQTELYLGLLHMTDGFAGAQRRIAAARRHVESFGVATECGFGRRPEQTVRPLLELHSRVLEACAAG